MASSRVSASDEVVGDRRRSTSSSGDISAEQPPERGTPATRAARTTRRSSPPPARGGPRPSRDRATAAEVRASVPVSAPRSSSEVSHIPPQGRRALPRGLDAQIDAAADRECEPIPGQSWIVGPQHRACDRVVPSLFMASDPSRVREVGKRRSTTWTSTIFGTGPAYLFCHPDGICLYDDNHAGVRRHPGPGRASVQDVEPPSPNAGKSSWTSARAGICGTDIEFFTGEMPYLHPPLRRQRELSHPPRSRVDGHRVRGGRRCGAELAGTTRHR